MRRLSTKARRRVSARGRGMRSGGEARSSEIPVSSDADTRGTGKDAVSVAVCRVRRRRADPVPYGETRKPGGCNKSLRQITSRMFHVKHSGRYLPEAFVTAPRFSSLPIRHRIRSSATNPANGNGHRVLPRSARVGIRRNGDFARARLSARSHPAAARGYPPAGLCRQPSHNEVLARHPPARAKCDLG